MPPRSDAPLLPERLGPYRCLRKLAVGGMGEVYLAEAQGAGNFRKRVVVKAVRADRADEQDVVQAFLDEARVWALLTHPNIVPLFDCVWLEGRLCLVMEYIEGADLRELIQAAQGQQQPIPLGIVVHLCTQLAAALHAAHEARGPDGKLLGVVHRDVSPHNLLVDREANARLCDFGIARSALRQNRTRSGRFKGKFAYVSPEAIRGDPLDRRADVFGMGVLLYELLSLERPFQAEGPVPLLRAILETEPTPIAKRRSDVSKPLAAVVERAMAKLEADRFPTAEALRLALLATPEAVPAQKLEDLIAWFDGLTGIVEDEPSTEPLMLGLAARAAARAIRDEADDQPETPSIAISLQPVESLRPITDVLTGESTVPRLKSPPPHSSARSAPSPKLARPHKPLDPAQLTSPTVLRSAPPPTYDLLNARTQIRSDRTPRGNRWRRRLREIGPWAMGGALFGGATILILLYFWK